MACLIHILYLEGKSCLQDTGLPTNDQSIYLEDDNAYCVICTYTVPLALADSKLVWRGGTSKEFK